MDLINNDQVADVIRQASARFIMPRFKALKDHEISSKTAPNDLVTLADIEAEAFLEKELPKIKAGSFVMGEEGVSRGEHYMDDLKNADNTVWVVDPVDGTHNFVHGNDKFAVMVALVKGGVTICGWIYDVLNDAFTICEKGAGAFDGDKRLSLEDKECSLKDHDIYLSPKFFPAVMRDQVKANRANFGKAVTIGCAAHEYLDVARGLKDGTVYCRLKPWDHLVGALLVQEAGGYVAKWDNSTYTPQDHYAGLIAACGKTCWERIHQGTFEGIDLETFMNKQPK